MQHVEHATKAHHVAFYFRVLSFDGNVSVNDPRAVDGYYLREFTFLSQRELGTVKPLEWVLITRHWDDLNSGLEGVTILQPDCDYLER
jgi:hypothetical protein